MARKLRATHAGIHHVFARSQVDDPLFRDDHDHLRFETELRTICAHEIALTCIAACTIGTHYHLLLEVEDGVLPKVMKQLNSAYARAFNARYQRRGHAFASRYGSKPGCALTLPTGTGAATARWSAEAIATPSRILRRCWRSATDRSRSFAHFVEA